MNWSATIRTLVLCSILVFLHYTLRPLLAWRASADKTRLGSDESKMSLVSIPHFLTDRRDHHCGRRLLFCDSPSVYRCVFVFCQSPFSQ